MSDRFGVCVSVPCVWCGTPTTEENGHDAGGPWTRPFGGPSPDCVAALKSEIARRRGELEAVQNRWENSWRKTYRAMIERLVEYAKHPEYPEGDPPIVDEGRGLLALDRSGVDLLVDARAEERAKALEEAARCVERERERLGVGLAAYLAKRIRALAAS